MTEQREQSQQGISAARRRLLKASAAAPLMASLAPNSAFAVSSLACTEKSATLTPDNDAAFRQPAMKYTKKSNNQNLPDVLYEIEGFDFGPTGFFEPDGEQFTFGNMQQLTSNYDSAPVDLAVMFDLSDPTNPQLSGLWPAVQLSDGTAPLAASCATSLIPTLLDF